MSKTEQDIEASTPSDHLDALAAADDSADQDGPSTAELDALDESLVGSITEYTSGGRLQSDESDVQDDHVVTDDELVELVEPELVEHAESDDEGTEQGDTEPAGHTEDADELAEDTEPEPGEPEPADLASVEPEYADVDDLQLVATGVADPDDAALITTDMPRTEETDAAPTSLVEAQTDGAGTTTIEQPAVSSSILDELRRADIDGPVVGDVPQDDTTSGRRRPKRALDYDPAPVPIPLKVPRILGRKPRVRKVTRVVRHVDPWSVFKIGVIANLVLYVVVLTAGVLLWNVAYATGTVENVERFFESFGWQSFDFNGGQIYHSAWIAGLFAVIGLTGLWVLLATLFNLITDLVGGVRFTVLEEEVVESRTSPMRRFVVRRAEPEIPAVLEDNSGALIREAVVDDSGRISR